MAFNGYDMYVKIGVDRKDMDKDLKKVENDLKKSKLLKNKLLTKLGVDPKEFDEKMEKAHKKVEKLATAVKKVGTTMGSALGKVGKFALDATTTALKATTAALGGAVAGVVALAKQSYSAYANYQQLVGGVQKLYGNMNMSLEDWAARQHKTVMAPYPKYYLDYWQADPDSEPLAMGGPTLLRTMYEYNPVPDVLDAEQQRYIIGVEGCVWTEYMPTPARVEYMAWPRMCAIAESGWSSAPKDWDGFTRRLETHLGRLDELRVGYCQAFYDPFIELRKDTEFSKVALLSVDAPDAEIRYTLDGSTPTARSPLRKLMMVAV